MDTDETLIRECIEKMLKDTTTTALGSNCPGYYTEPDRCINCDLIFNTDSRCPCPCDYYGSVIALILANIFLKEGTSEHFKKKLILFRRFQKETLIYDFGFPLKNNIISIKRGDTIKFDSMYSQSWTFGINPINRYVNIMKPFPSQDYDTYFIPHWLKTDVEGVDHKNRIIVTFH